MYLFPVVWEDFNVVKSRFPSSAAWRPVATQAGGLSFPLLVGQQEVALHPAGCEE
jgi:hypothetical protein